MAEKAQNPTVTINERKSNIEVVLIMDRDLIKDITFQIDEKKRLGTMRID